MFEMFPYIFSNVFNSLVNNRELIDNIVDSVLNSEIMGDMINALDSMVNLEIEIKEYKRAYIIEANLPGITKKDINVDYSNNYVTVEVKRNQVFNNGKNIAIAVVQTGDNLVKDFYVENVDAKNIKAVFKNELLRVYIPKKDNELTIVEVNEFISE